MLRGSGVLLSTLVAGCYCSHPLPMDGGMDVPEVGIDAPDAGIDACVIRSVWCDEDVEASALQIPTQVTFDGVRLSFTRVEMVTSLAFAVFHQVTLLPDATECTTSLVRILGWPESTDPHELGPREAIVQVEMPPHPTVHETTGIMDVLAYDDDTHVWHGRLFVDDARLQLDLDITVLRCTDVSGP